MGRHLWYRKLDRLQGDGAHFAMQFNELARIGQEVFLVAKVLNSVDIVRVRVGVHAADVSRLDLPGSTPRCQLRGPQ
jgi:hypothetical protein